jgi:dihydrofolate reductase
VARNVYATYFMTLDGVVQDPHHWSFPFWNEETATFKNEELRKTDILLLGRKTYEGFAQAWPSRKGQDDFSTKFNTMPKYLVSSTVTDPEWNNTSVITGDVVGEVRKLKEQLDGVIQVPGSIQLVQELIENDLVDEIHLMTFPVILGTGRRLFGETSDKSTWKLADAKAVGEGIPITIFQRAAEE